MKLDALAAQNAANPRPDFKGERVSVRVNRLRLEAEVGVYDSERGRKQPLEISLEAEVAPEATHPQGALGDAVNYAAMAETVRQIVGAAHHDLLEDLAQTIADTLFTDPRVKRLDLTLDKLTALEDAQSVGVTLSRWR
ncbi:dihydroneopterin aldolase [Oceanicaulis sp.]|uniref:dihydroneopterin aldolase n=1 Tax=Oceanicaulis sp. TaxID=1924941 RepID=UPI003F70EEC9